jgi:exodeoxyribonuclease VII large subunit
VLNRSESPPRAIFTVSELTREIKDLLEMTFSDLWVEGEISNLRVPPSGHAYFTLKDDLSQIRAVLFKGQARHLRFNPEDGLQVICRGRVSLYEKRGEYQLILEAMEPKGIGALQLAFLQLRERLEKEGLFDAGRKRPLPMLPQKIGIVTSPTGAVIRDMLHIIDRRFENVHILLYPVRVQGEGASSEIAAGIDYLNQHEDVDVIIVGRGGGSLEDLWAFNEEAVARAIYRSRVPVVSAVGHETDYTIADFVADLRAPTPSAAAELVVTDKRETKNAILSLTIRLESRMLRALQEVRTHLSHLRRIMGDPKKRIEEHLLRVDERVNRMILVMSWTLKRDKEQHLHHRSNLFLRNPLQRIQNLRLLLSQREKGLVQDTRHGIEIRKKRLEGMLGKLDSLSPLAILRRGYSITRKPPSLEIVTSASQVREGEKVEVRLHEGTLLCGVERAKPS